MIAKNILKKIGVVFELLIDKLDEADYNGGSKYCINLVGMKNENS